MTKVKYPQLHDREWLRQQNKTSLEIAAQLGCTPSAVRMAFSGYGERRQYHKASHYGDNEVGSHVIEQVRQVLVQCSRCKFLHSLNAVYRKGSWRLDWDSKITYRNGRLIHTVCGQRMKAYRNGGPRYALLPSLLPNLPAPREL